MTEVLTIGEPMGLMAAEEVKPLKDVRHFTRYVCGAEINFSVGMARLEHRIAYISRVGKDPFGQHIKDFLNDNHIVSSYVCEDPAFLTGMQLKAKVTSGDPEVVNFRKNTAFSHLSENDLEHIDWNGVRYLHATGIPPALSDSCRSTIYKLFETAKAHGVKISFDPNLRPALWRSEAEMRDVINDLAAKADYILPGQSEGTVLTHRKDPEEIADFYFNSGSPEAVFIKCGIKGAYVKTRNGDIFEVPAFRAEKVVDTVGAGDGFAVGVVSALLEGEDIPAAARRGTAIGALAIMSPGDNDGLPTREELFSFMKK